MEEKILAISVRKIQNSKEVSFLFSAFSGQLEARYFPYALLVESCSVRTVISSWQMEMGTSERLKT